MDLDCILVIPSWAMPLVRKRSEILQVEDEPGVVRECDRQWQRGVAHPEFVAAGPVEDEQHSPIGWQRGPTGQAKTLLGRSVGNLNRELSAPTRCRHDGNCLGRPAN